MSKPLNKESVFHKSLPILLPSLVNRCGTIGINLLPIFLVDRQVSAESAALTITAVKSAAILGIFLGGWLSDYLLLRTVITLSFLLAGSGMLFLPFSHGLFWIGLFGVIAQVAQSMFPSSAQLMLGRILSVPEQREAVGWLRTANNLGSICSYSLGWIFSAAGPAALMIFDSVTSFLAAALGLKQMPAVHLRDRDRAAVASANAAPGADGRQASLLTTVLTVFVATGFAFLFEIFCTGCAAKMRVQFGADGMKYFSQVMVINTVLCTSLAVIAARRLHDPAFALPTGVLLATLGCLMLVSSRLEWMLVGAFAWTIGEVCFQALINFVLLRVTTHAKRAGAAFGTVTLVQISGRTLGGAAAFPVYVGNWHPTAVIATVGATSLVVTLFLIPRWRALLAP